LHIAQLMPLPLTVSCFSKIQIGFTFLVPANLGSPGKRAVKRVCVTLLNMNQSVQLAEMLELLILALTVMQEDTAPFGLQINWSITKILQFGNSTELINILNSPGGRWTS